MNNITIVRNFYNDFTQVAGGGTPYWNAPVAHRGWVYIGLSIAWNMTDARLIFDSETKTIRMLNPYDSRRFTTQGFKVGDDITVVDTASNDGDLTITAISDDGLTITVAETLVNEKDRKCSVHGVTPVTGMDLYSNLIPSAAAENYFSMTNPKSLMKFSVSGIDSTDTSTVVPFRVATKFLDWVTNVITDTTENSTTEVTIKGAGIVGYAQTFIIHQKLITTPLNLVSQYYNFSNLTPPDYYTSGSSLRHVCAMWARYDSDAPSFDQTGVLTTPDGIGQWFDQGPSGSSPQYLKSSITYQDSDTMETLGRLDIGKKVLVTMTLNSLKGKFVPDGMSDGTVVEVGFFTNPSDPSEYQQTLTTMVQNFYRDQARGVAAGAVVQGEMNGTDYQVIKDLMVVYTSAYLLTITFKFDPGESLIDYWKSKYDSDRFYTLYATTQDIKITTTKGTDMVPVLMDFQSADWNKVDDSLFEFSGSGQYAYQYPDSSVNGFGSINGFAGDPWVVKIPFRVDNQYNDAGTISPTVQKIAFQVLAKKSGKTDFFLDEFVIDCSGMKKLDGVQQLRASETRGFISYDGDPRNAVTLERDASADTAEMAGYVANYGLVLRYEDWISAEIQPGSRSDGTTPDIALDIDEITHNWANYSGVEGWDLSFRFAIVVRGIDGIDNPYYSDIAMTVIDADSTSWAGSSGAKTQTLRYYEYDFTGAGLNAGWAGEEINCIQTMGTTLIRMTWTGNFPVGNETPPISDSWYAWIMLNSSNGSIFDRRFASSELQSEDTSPMSDPGVDPLADISYALGNVRINIYTGVKIVAETLVDSTLWGEDSDPLQVFQRLGAKYFTT